MTNEKYKIIIVLIAALSCLGGCGKSDGENFSLQKSVTEMFTGTSPNQLVNQAFYSPDPDMQRQAIDELTKTDDGLKEPYIKGYASLLQYQMKLKPEDRHPTLICSTIRALGKAGDTAYAPNVLAAANDPDAIIRSDTAVALGNLNTDDSFKTLKKLAMSDANTEVRMNACSSLAGYQTQPSLDTLIEAMRDNQFAVRFQAHQSLIKMTGKDMGTNYSDWAGVKLSDAPTTQPSKHWWKFW